MVHNSETWYSLDLSSDLNLVADTEKKSIENESNSIEMKGHSLKKLSNPVVPSRSLKKCLNLLPQNLSSPIVALGDTCKAIR